MDDLLVDSGSWYERWHRCLLDHTGRSLSPPPSLSPHTSPPGASTTSNQHQTAVSSRPSVSPTPMLHLQIIYFALFCFLYSSGFPPTLPPLDQESETSGSHFNALVVLCGCLSATLFTFTLCITEKKLYKRDIEGGREGVIQWKPAKWWYLNCMQVNTELTKC